MKSAIVILIIAIALVGCLSSPPPGNGNESGTGGNASKSINVTRISYHLDSPEGFPTFFEWGNGTIWFIFKLKDGSQTDAYYVPSNDGGKTWDTDNPVKLTQGATNTEHNTIVRFGSKVLLAWDDSHKIYIQSSKDDGHSWETLDLGLDNGWYPFFFKKGNELWLLHISKKQGDGGTIRYISTTDGVSWSKAKTIKENPDKDGNTSVYGNAILYETGGKLWLVWDTGAEVQPMSDLLYSTSSDGGLAWSETMVLTNTSEIDEVDPFICRQSDGNDMMVYASSPKGQNPGKYSDFGTGEVYDIWYRCFKNGTWTNGKEFSQELNTQYLEWYPSCFKTSGNTMLLAFCSDRDAPESTGLGSRECYVATLPKVC